MVQVPRNMMHILQAVVIVASCFAAAQALSEMLDKHAGTINTYGLSKVRIMTLVNECLKCNTFKWSGTYFSQIRGLAMGQRLAPVLAICFMSRVEEPVLARMPQMYCRYIDDCCIVTSTQSEMDECFRILNQQSQYIKFTRETPKNGWLPYLNTKVKLSNGIFQMKWYRKESSKNILINAKSAHPFAIKRAVVRNMFKTASMVCTGEQERNESRRMASQIASSNGYTVSQRSRKHHPVNRMHNHEGSRIPLCLPFISDEVSAAIQKCIFRAQLQNDVVLVSIPNANIKKQLVRNRLYDRQCISEQCIVCPHGKEGDCAKEKCTLIRINEEFSGRNVGVNVIGNVNDCAFFCYSNDECHSFVFKHGKGTDCYLYAIPGDERIPVEEASIRFNVLHHATPSCGNVTWML
ncbi:hypothetical protein Y032_0009g677 [Ancylostoma ceylanicum]|nr:hypothetical protein Y032_0009g677 [Ancylostoma ceylanicum]